MSASGTSLHSPRRTNLVANGLRADNGRRWRDMTRARLTHSVDLLRDFGATQHVKRAAIPTYKCLISYSITSSAIASTAGGTSMWSARAV
jgi:hypothetical protein